MSNKFCCLKVFCLAGNTIHISNILASNLKHNTMWFCCHKVVSSGKVFSLVAKTVGIRYSLTELKI